MCADIHRPQTTPFFGLVQDSPPESSYRLLYRGSNATAHIPQKLSSFCTSFGAPSLAKAPAKLSWTTIRTLLLISSPAQRLHHHLSCAPLAMRSCETLSHVLMATAMSKSAKLGLRSEGGSESSSMIVLQVLLPRMEHQTKRKRRRAFGGCGQWRLIPNTAEDRTTPVEGLGRGQKRGWSVVCEYLRASQRAQSPAGQQIFFFF